MEYKDIINDFKNSKIIDSDIIFEDSTIELSYAHVKKILERSYPLRYDESNDLLMYIDENGDEHIAPDLSEGMSKSSTWLSDKLPESKIDFEQGGNMRKQDEASSIYKLECIAICIPSFKEEILEELSNYNFVDFAFKNDRKNTYVNAREFLKEYEELNSLRINSIISSANIRITTMMEKKDVHWKTKLMRKEISEYAALSREIKSIILNYEKNEKLNPVEIRNLSKVDRLMTIDNREREIQTRINESAIGTLYRIIKINSEYIVPTVKRKIISKSREFANHVILRENLTGIDADERFDFVFRKMVSDLNRYTVATIRSREIDKYRELGKEYTLKSKS